VTPLVLGIVLGLGFLLLLVALQAPLAAALGVVTNLLAVGAAFGVGRLIFQDGHGAGFLGFTSQGYVDAWAPVFFFAMIFAISMDYTVFLLSSAKEHWERSHDAHANSSGSVTEAHGGKDSGQPGRRRPAGATGQPQQHRQQQQPQQQRVEQDRHAQHDAPISLGGNGREMANVKKTATITATAAKMTRPEWATPPTIA